MATCFEDLSTSLRSILRVDPILEALFGSATEFSLVAMASVLVIVKASLRICLLSKTARLILDRILARVTFAP